MCESKCKKISFSDEKYAIYFLEKLERTSSKVRIPQEAYLCPKCFNWHVTSQKVYINRKVTELENKEIQRKKEVATLQNKLKYYRDLLKENNINIE